MCKRYFVGGLANCDWHSLRYPFKFESPFHPNQCRSSNCIICASKHAYNIETEEEEKLFLKGKREHQIFLKTILSGIIGFRQKWNSHSDACLSLSCIFNPLHLCNHVWWIGLLLFGSVMLEPTECQHRLIIRSLDEQNIRKFIVFS